MDNYALSTFPVTAVPIQMEGIVNPDKYQFIVRNDTSEVISCVTNEYKLVTNEEILETAFPHLDEVGAELSECEVFGNGARTTWTWKIPDIKVDVGGKDYVNPQITIRNSYDGTVQLHILAGAFRLVCSNGLIIGTTVSRKVNRHSIYNVGLDKIGDSITDTIETVENVFRNDLPLLTETKTNATHVKNLIELFPDFTMEPLTQYLIGNKPDTFWDLLNAATWVTTHAMKRNVESTHTLEKRIYPEITKWAKAVA